MKWLKQQFDNWKSKSVGRKISDVAFIVIMLFLFIPQGRIVFQRALVQIGVFNLGVDFDHEGPELSQTEWGITLRDRNGNSFNLERYKGKIIFLNFWATWCPPCKAELPTIFNLIGKMKHREDIVFVLASSESFEVVDGLLTKYEAPKNLPTYQLITNHKSLVFDGPIPTTAVIDKSGKLVYQHVGMLNYGADSFISELEELTE